MLDRLTPFVKPFYQDDLLLNTIRKDRAARFECTPFYSNAIVVGRASCIEKEVNLVKAISDEIPIFRRKGGGCAVFLDPGNLIVSVIFPAHGFLNIQKLFKRASLWLLNGLKDSGIKSIYQDGISDIAICGRKVGGSCFYRAKGIAYFSASILVSSDLHGMQEYLHFPPRSPKYRQGRSHLDFVTNLDSHFKGISTQSLALDLEKNLNLFDLRS